MFSICTAYIENGKLEETLKQFSESEKKLTKEIGLPPSPSTSNCYGMMSE